MEKMRQFLKLLRPRQWFKAFYIIFGAVPAIILTQFNISTIAYLLVLGITSIVLMQGSVYILNDVSDIEEDRIHPIKKNRPIAGGKIKRNEAMALAVILLAAGLALSWYLDIKIFLINATFFALNVAYSVRPIRMRDRMYADIFMPAFNFPLRVMVGWFLFDPSVESVAFVSMTIFTYFMACFLLSLKRLSEKNFLGQDCKRKTLKCYSISTLEKISMISSIIVVASSIILALSIKTSFIILVPFNVYGLKWYYNMAKRKDSPAKQPEDMFDYNSFRILVISFLIVALILIVIP
jgi:4-hydroxybenzoate polyprenyltransferase